MSTDKQIEVVFVNNWDSRIENISLRFSASESGVETNTYNIPYLEKGQQSSQLLRNYRNGFGSELFDYWYVEFVATSGKNPGKHWNKNNFSCVVDSDVDNTKQITFWVNSGDTNCYLLFPTNDGYESSGKDSQGRDYTCYCSLEST